MWIIKYKNVDKKYGYDIKIVEDFNMWPHVNIRDFLVFLLGCWFAGMVYVFYGGIVERKYWRSEGEIVYLVFASFFWSLFIVADWLKWSWKKFVGY